MTQRQGMQRIIISYLIILLIPTLCNLISVTRSYTNLVMTICDLIGAGWLLYLSLHIKEKAPLEQHSTSRIKIIQWGIIGAFCCVLFQLLIVFIEHYCFHSIQASLNTNMLITGIKSLPLMALAVLIAAPIMEEIVFRKIIFGDLCQFTNKWLAALIASVLFALTHADGHLLVYTIIGMIFCYLYQKTGSVYTSMIAHILMNTFIVISYLWTIH